MSLRVYYYRRLQCCERIRRQPFLKRIELKWPSEERFNEIGSVVRTAGVEDVFTSPLWLFHQQPLRWTRCKAVH